MIVVIVPFTSFFCFLDDVGSDDAGVELVAIA